MTTVENGVVAALAIGLESIFDLPPEVWSAADQKVHEVNVSFNAITSKSLHALAPFASSLKTLILDNNELSDLEGLPSLPQLVTLWLNNNSITEVEGVLNILARQCPQLEYLSLLRNPCCPNELTGRLENEYRRYRLYTKYRLPTLKTLDTAKFTDEETAEAKEKGKFFRTAVAKTAGDDTSSPNQGQTSTNFGRTNKEAAPVPTEAAAPSAPQEEEEDLFAKYEKKKAPVDVDKTPSTESTGPSYFSQQRHFYSGKTSEGNRFIRDDVL